MLYGVHESGLENTAPTLALKFLLAPRWGPLPRILRQEDLCSDGSIALASATPPGSLLRLHKDNAVFISTPLNSTHIAKTECKEQEGGRKKNNLSLSK